MYLIYNIDYKINVLKYTMDESINLPVVVEPAKLLGADIASRYIGGVTDVAPTEGTFAIGDYVVAQSGKIWVCTVAGTPGTWAQISGSGLPSSIEYYANLHLDQWSAIMYTDGISTRGTGTLWMLDNLPSELPHGDVQSITVFNSNITATSMFFITPILKSPYAGGIFPQIWVGERLVGQRIVIYVANHHPSMDFTANWALQVLMVQAN